MTTLEHGLEEIATQPPAVLVVDVVKLDLPYIVMLSMAVLGIGMPALVRGSSRHVVRTSRLGGRRGEQ